MIFECWPSARRCLLGTVAVRLKWTDNSKPHKSNRWNRLNRKKKSNRIEEISINNKEYNILHNFLTRLNETKVLILGLGAVAEPLSLASCNDH